jgi:hypothetical protein
MVITVAARGGRAAPPIRLRYARSGLHDNRRDVGQSHDRPCRVGRGSAGAMRSCLSQGGDAESSRPVAYRERRGMASTQFPVAAVRHLYALELPRGELRPTLLIAALGVAALTAFWLITRTRDRPRTPAAAESNRAGWTTRIKRRRRRF